MIFKCNIVYFVPEQTIYENTRKKYYDIDAFYQACCL
jgi:hypothetical protein